MKKFITVIILTLVNFAGPIFANSSLDSLLKKLDLGSEISSTNCDTVIDYKGYALRVVRKDDQLRFLGLNLFHENMKNVYDRETLSHIETAIFAKSQKIENSFYNNVRIISGDISDFKKITPDTDCSISTTNLSSMVVTWKLNGKNTAVTLPLGYEIVRQGNRTQIEDELISRLKNQIMDRENTEFVDTVNLEPYKDDLFIYPSSSYLNKNITSNIYFQSGDTLKPVWSKKYPLESIANLLLYPSTIYGDPSIELKVLKHEYGKIEELTISLINFLRVFENDGCSAYWGVESFENGLLKGALFFLNQYQGYDHVVSIECKPEDVIAGNGVIKARASLYIPTNNVDNLFQPYVKKTKDEKIKYKN